jgi:hypothetical protein
MPTRRKLLVTAGVLVVVGALGALASFSAFRATTANTANAASSGTVKIDQHAGATTLYNVTDAKPGQQTIKCVRVTYAGSLPSSVKLYVSSGIQNAWLFNLKVERGSGLTTLNSTMSCAGFSPSSTAYDQVLDNFPQSFATSSVDGKAGGAAWSNGDSVDYRFTIEPTGDPAWDYSTPTSTGAHTFTWEAQNN